jgi:hypothetical protein
MGFSSIDDFLAEQTSGKNWRADFMKIFTGGTVVAGRWYDLTYFGGAPAQYIHGNYVRNADFLAGAMGWTASAGFAWTAATHLMTKSGGNAETLTQNTSCVNGTAYSVVYTLGSYAGSGNVSVSLGGTAGTNRTSNGTYRETITCGATANAPLVITVAGTVSAATIDVVAITRDLAFTPYSDTIDCGLWHGGNVSTDTKHLVNVGAWTNAATGAPSVLMLVDMLGCYPRIATNSSSLQTLNNTLTLPRYTAGAGVRAFFSLEVSNGANAQNFAMTYTNSSSVGSRSLGATVANTASAIQSHISHSGVAAGNYGPFLPLMAPDAGVKSVESCQFSAASASAGLGALVLCRPLVTLPITTAFMAAERDLMNQLPSLPRLVDGACIGFLHFAGAVTASGVQFQGYLDAAWG